ncbi:hypothetical protein PMAYCL1PPCAC_22441, partial [Pristionchus mayeri]
YNAKVVEGSAGKTITQITNLVHDLGSHFYWDWNNSWEDKSGNQTIYRQQIFAQATIRELQTAMLLLHEIFGCRKTEQDNALEDKMQASKSTGADPLSEAHELEPLFEAPNEVKEEPVESKNPRTNPRTQESKNENSNNLSDFIREELSLDVRREPVPSTDINRELVRMNEETVGLADIKQEEP